MPSDMLSREIYGDIGSLSKIIFYILATASIICFAYGVWRRVRGVGDWASQAVPPSNGLRYRATLRFESRHAKEAFSKSRRRGPCMRLMFGGFLVLFIGTVLIAIEH